MLESIKQYAEALSGLTEVPRRRARRIAQSLSSQGVIPTGQIRSVTSAIVERSRQNRKRLTNLVVTQMRKQAGTLGLATADEIERLRRRILALEGVGSTKTVAKKPAGKRTAAKTKPKAKPARRAAAASKPRKAAKKPTTKPRKRASATRRR